MAVHYQSTPLYFGEVFSHFNYLGISVFILSMDKNGTSLSIKINTNVAYVLHT